MFAGINDSIEAIEQAALYGMKGVVLKCHHSMTADRATLVNKVVQGATAYGGIVLNRYVGGINPHAVEAAIRLGAKIVWMPTQWAQHHLTTYGAPEYHHMKRAASGVSAQTIEAKGVTVLDDSGNLTSDTLLVLEMIAAADIALGTGHLTKEEIQKIVHGAKLAGVKRILINHITLSELWNWTIEEQKALIADGAMIEHVAIFCMKNRYLIDPEEVAKRIEGVGYENVAIASDCGQMKNPAPADALHLFLTMLLDVGMDAVQLETMMRRNPAFILGVE